MAKNDTAAASGTASSSHDALGAEKSADKATVARREIPGGLPYLNSHGTLKRILDRTIDLARPDKFNYDFLENVVKITGGAARACIPIMKKMGLLNSDNTTTDLYGRFRTEGGRSAAAHAALKNAFPEIFKRSDYAYKIEDSKLRDIIVEITGLKANDPVAQAIKGTFGVIKGYVDPTYNGEGQGEGVAYPIDVSRADGANGQNAHTEQGSRPLGLSYNINIVLPETSDLNVLNAIFRSVRENLLQ